MSIVCFCYKSVCIYLTFIICLCMSYTRCVSKTSLVEKHMERIHSLEAALRQRDSSLHKFNTQLHSKDMQYLQLHASPDTHSESFSALCACVHVHVYTLYL